MVADGGSIVAHHIHQAHLHISLEQGIIGGALREVATVEQQQVGMGTALFSYHGCPAHKTAAACHQGVGQIFAERKDAAVCVVGVENNDCFRLFGH